MAAHKHIYEVQRPSPRRDLAVGRTVGQTIGFTLDLPLGFPVFQAVITQLQRTPCFKLFSPVWYLRLRPIYLFYFLLSPHKRLSKQCRIFRITSVLHTVNTFCLLFLYTETETKNPQFPLKQALGVVSTLAVRARLRPWC